MIQEDLVRLAHASDPLARFLSHVRQESNGCLVWTGCSRDGDYGAFKVNGHVEVPRGSGSWCEECGNVDDLDPRSPAAILYHGDSFGLEVPVEDWEALEEMVRREHPLAADAAYGISVRSGSDG